MADPVFVMRIEWIPLTFNALICAYYVVNWQGPGRPLYWLGATILTSGLLFLKG